MKRESEQSPRREMTAAPIVYRVIYGDTDAMGVVYNANYLRIFEMARTETMRALGVPYSEIEEDGVALPVVEAHIRYRSPARYDDLLKIRTRAAAEGQIRIRFDYEITHGETGRLVAEGFTVHAAVDAAKGRPLRLPRKLRDLLFPCP